MATKTDYTSVKAEEEQRTSALFDECEVFWAFSNEQFDEGKAKHPLQDGEKYVSIGAGGYMPRGYYETLVKGMDEIDAWKKEAMREVKAEQAILHELNNYECFYTGEIAGALEVLEPMGYTAEQVREVYRNNNDKTDWIN